MEAASPKYTGNLLGRAFRHCSQWGSLQSGLLYYYQLLALVLLGSTERAPDKKMPAPGVDTRGEERASYLLRCRNGENVTQRLLLAPATTMHRKDGSGEAGDK